MFKDVACAPRRVKLKMAGTAHDAFVTHCTTVQEAAFHAAAFTEAFRGVTR